MFLSVLSSRISLQNVYHRGKGNLASISACPLKYTSASHLWMNHYQYNIQDFWSPYFILSTTWHQQCVSHFLLFSFTEKEQKGRYSVPVLDVKSEQLLLSSNQTLLLNCRSVLVRHPDPERMKANPFNSLHLLNLCCSLYKITASIIHIVLELFIMLWFLVKSEYISTHLPYSIYLIKESMWALYCKRLVTCLPSDRGRWMLTWVFPPALARDQIRVVDSRCGRTKQHYCSRLMVSRTKAENTGQYSCRYQHRTEKEASVYVYMTGKTLLSRAQQWDFAFQSQ